MSTDEEKQRGIEEALRSNSDVRQICQQYRIATFRKGLVKLGKFGIRLTEINPKLLTRVWNRLDSNSISSIGFVPTSPEPHSIHECDQTKFGKGKGSHSFVDQRCVSVDVDARSNLKGR